MKWGKLYKIQAPVKSGRARELCSESRGGRPGLPSLISHTVSVDVKQHSTKSAKFGPDITYRFDSALETSVLLTAAR